MLDPLSLKRWIGHVVDIDRMDGGHVHGRLLNVNRASCWLVDDDEDQDCFVPLSVIARWQPAA